MMPRPQTLPVACYCLCGDTMRGRANPEAAAFLAATFDQHHTGDGHGPATPRQAAAARRRHEAQLARQEADRG